MCVVPVKSIHLYYRFPPFLSPAPWASRSPQPRSSVILEMTGGESQYINLWVVGEDSGEVAFTVKKTTPLRKLMRRYSESIGVGVTSLRFFFDGFRICDAHTAEDVGLTANDKIEVYTGLGGYTRWVECSCTMFLCAC